MPSPSRRSPFADPRLLLPVVAMLAVGGFYGFRWFQAGVARQQQRSELLAEVQEVLGKGPPDAEVLSRLMAGLKDLPDHQESPELLAAQAAIELARDRAARAADLFAAIATLPGASTDQQRLGSRILLRCAEASVGDVNRDRELLDQVDRLSAAAYTADRLAPDLLRQWQACQRRGRYAEAKALAERLLNAHADSPAARLVALLREFEDQRARVEALAGEFAEEPAELGAMRLLITLQRGDMQATVMAADAAFRRWPGVPAVRMAIAIVDHTCALASANDEDRAGWVERRDVHLQFLMDRMPADDPQRPTWLQMSSVR